MGRPRWQAHVGLTQRHQSEADSMRAMGLRDMVLAALTSVIWGFGFVAVKFGLESFSAPQLTAVRFLLACLPMVLVPRPTISWWSIALIGMTQFTGQFLLLLPSSRHAPGSCPPRCSSVRSLARCATAAWR